MNFNPMRKRKYSLFFIIHPSVFILFFLAPSLLFAQSYSGGSYDGYGNDSPTLRFGYPSVDNASGATNVLPQSVCLNGTLVDIGSVSTLVYVYWGLADGGTNAGGWANSFSFGACTQMQSLTTSVTLSPYTTYYYRFYATNAAGEQVWASYSETFTTPGPPAFNNGIGAEPIAGGTAAVLHGILTNGTSAAITVYWGADSNSWANTNSLGTLGLGDFSQRILGLTPGAVYYYRCYGTNTWGDSWSPTVMFTAQVGSAVFYGGGYDGYDGDSVLSTFIQLMDGTIFYFQ